MPKSAEMTKAQASRGATRQNPHITSCTVSWKIDFSDDIWKAAKELSSKLPKDAIPERFDHKRMALIGPMLSSSSPNVGQIFCSISRDRTKLIWSVGLRLHPKGKPPAFVTKASEKIGGLEGGLKFLKDIHGEEPSIPATYRVLLELDEKSGWRCKLVPREASKDFKLLGSLSSSATMEQVGFRFQGGVLGLDELALIYYHTAKHYELNFSAKGVLRLGDKSFSYVDVLAATICKELFTNEQANS